MCFDPVLLAQASGMTRTIGFVVDECETQVDAAVEHLRIPTIPSSFLVPFPVCWIWVFPDRKSERLHPIHPLVSKEICASRAGAVHDLQRVGILEGESECEIQYEIDQTSFGPIPTTGDKNPE